MAENNVLRWPDGNGWLVFSGAVMIESEIRALVLERATAEGGVAYVSVNTPDGYAAQDDMDDLGAPTGYLVDVLSEDDESLRKSLGDASIIVLEDTLTVETLLSAVLGTAQESMLQAYERGAIVFAEGRAAEIFGAWVHLADGQFATGLGWLPSVQLIPGVSSLGDSDVAKAVLSTEPFSIALGIGPGSAIALGPNGEVELWGERQVTLALGSGYKN